MSNNKIKAIVSKFNGMFEGGNSEQIEKATAFSFRIDQYAYDSSNVENALLKDFAAFEKDYNSANSGEKK